MNRLVRHAWMLLCIGPLLALAGCKSLPAGRKDASDVPGEMALALYVTDNANPNPDAPVESGPAAPPIRIELSGDSLDDMAAQLAAMSKLIEQERQAPGSAASASSRSEPVAPGVQNASEATQDSAEQKSEGQADPKALQGLPPSAVFERALPAEEHADGATANTRSLGTYGGEDATPAVVGAVTVQRGKPSPLAIQVVQLRDDSVLLSADYDALAIDLKKALGTTYLRHDDYVLKPGQYKTVPLRKLDKETLYVGVIAAYHEIDLRRWKAVYRLDAAARRYGVLMVFDEDGALIRTEQQK